MRLSTVLTPQERQTLTLTMLEDVLQAVKHSVVGHIVVIGSDPAVKVVANNFRVTYLEEKQHGLNEAIKQATKWCILNSADSVLILPSDIPLLLPEDVNQIIQLCTNRDSLVLSPSFNRGTNALLQKPPNLLPTHFGQNSFHKHKTEAQNKGIPTMIYTSERVSLDVDSPEDLKKLLTIETQTKSQKFLEQIEANQRF
jgi:2-phospho-L-lactate guanylyltransferase